MARIAKSGHRPLRTGINVIKPQAMSQIASKSIPRFFVSFIVFTSSVSRLRFATPSRGTQTPRAAAAMFFLATVGADDNLRGAGHMTVACAPCLATHDYGCRTSTRRVLHAAHHRGDQQDHPPCNHEPKGIRGKSSNDPQKPQNPY